MKNKSEQNDQQKEMQKKRDNDQAVKRYCMTCKKETLPVRLCVCSGSGSGPAASGGESSEDRMEMKSVSASTGSASDKQSAKSEVGKSWSDAVKPTLTPKETMIGIIADLLAKKLLTIEDNKGLCTLTIKCDPKLLSESQRKAVKEFVAMVQNELDAFKNKNGLSDKDCFVRMEKDKQGNIVSFAITIPNPTLYDAFIQQLSNKNIVGFNKHQTQNETSAFNRTPFKTKPTPPGWKE